MKKKRKALTLLIVCLGIFAGLLFATLPTEVVRAQTQCFGNLGARRYNAALAASKRGDYAEALKSLAEYIACDMPDPDVDDEQVQRTYAFLVELAKANAKRTESVDDFASDLVLAGESINQVCPDETVSDLLKKCEPGTGSSDTLNQSCPGIVGQESALGGFDDSVWRLFQLAPTPSPFWPDSLPTPTPKPLWVPPDRLFPSDTTDVRFLYNLRTR